MIEYSHYNSPMSPQSFIYILYRRRKLIGTLFIGLTAGIIALTFILPAVYESNAQVMVNYQSEQEKHYLFGTNGSSHIPYNQLESEVVILKSREILENVIRQIGLDLPSIHPVQKQKYTEQQYLDYAYMQLKKKLNVERERDTNILNISYESHNPHLAAQVVQRIISSYMDKRSKLARDERAAEFLDKQIADIRQQIDAIESSGFRYKQSEQVMVPDKQSEILFNQLADFDQELTRIRSQRIAKEARLNTIASDLWSGQVAMLPNTEASESLSKMEYLNKLRKTQLDLELKRSSLKKKYTDKHPDVITVTQDIKQIESKIDNEIKKIMASERNAVESLKATEREIQNRMKTVADDIADLSKKDYQLGMMTIGIKDLKEVYSMLIRQREEAKIAANRKEHLIHVRLLEPAIVPLKPAKPNKPLFAAIAVVLGVVVSLGTAFFIEYFDHSVNTVEDAQYCLGLPILASISDVDSRLLRPKYIQAGPLHPESAVHSEN